MELLRRALLLGCILPGLWMLRLTFLEPLLIITPTEGAQGAVIHAGSGPAWNALVRDLTALERGQMPPTVVGRVTSGQGAGFRLFMPASGGTDGALTLAASSGGALVSIPKPQGEATYRLDLKTWSRADFRPGSGFVGQPRPPSSMLYPLRILGLALLLLGTALFAILPSAERAEGAMVVTEISLLVGVIVLFALPLFAVGGSVQSVTAAPWLTLPCWALAAVCMHLFANPRQHLHLHLMGDAAPTWTLSEALWHPGYLRTGLAFLGVAVGPAIAVVLASVTLWNR
jgi:hypothetical protein